MQKMILHGPEDLLIPFQEDKVALTTPRLRNTQISSRKIAFCRALIFMQPHFGPYLNACRFS